MASNGQAVARADSGKVVFVEGALPGETVLAELTGEHRSYSSARTVEVLQTSADREHPPCVDLARGCGGCPWQHVERSAELRMKQQLIVEALTRIGGVGHPRLEPVAGLDPWGYRTTLRAGVVDGRAALRMLHSASLVSAEHCLVVHPLISDLLQGSRYRGASEVVIRCGARTGERLVATTPDLVLDLPGDVARDHFHEVVAGVTWRISSKSFFQSRPDGAELLARMVGEAADGAGAPAEALDLYSGVGLFAGVLAERGWDVTAVERSASSVADARVNLSRFGVKVLRCDVAKLRPLPARLVVADPSRAGLGKAGARAVIATAASRVVLVSCDAASLGRDVGILTRAGYDLSSVTAVDMFPHTFRVEAVSVLDRATR
jgi:23S rRNA (uracil1939-C5)-methyltransferase